MAELTPREACLGWHSCMLLMMERVQGLIWRRKRKRDAHSQGEQERLGLEQVRLSNEHPLWSQARKGIAEGIFGMGEAQGGLRDRGPQGETLLHMLVLYWHFEVATKTGELRSRSHPGLTPWGEVLRRRDLPPRRNIAPKP